MEYINLKEVIKDNKTLVSFTKTLITTTTIMLQVVSGGVACNNFIAKGLKLVCDSYGYKLIRPPPKLCTDNGVMIAWNGVEK